MLAALLLGALPAGLSAASLVEPWNPNLHFPADAALAEQAARAHADLAIPIASLGARERNGSASAILIDRAGHLVTAAHVAVAAGSTIEISTGDARVHRARVLDIDPTQELALLRIRPYEGMPVARIEPRPALLSGEPVIAVGSGRNREAIAAVGRVLNGQGVETLRYQAYAIQHPLVLRISVARGFSGGPVVDAEGRLVGMIASFALDHYYGRSTTGTAYAVPLADILDYRDQVLARLVAEGCSGSVRAPC